jgi:peptide/nickel transport system ATP-binding protein
MSRSRSRSRNVGRNARWNRAGETVLSVTDLRISFYTDEETIRAVDGISFDVKAGETVGIVGESVTARSIMGLIESPGRIEEESSIRFGDRELTDLSAREYRRIRGSGIAMVFQDPLTSLNPVYTVGNQIREALRLHRGLRGSTATEAAVDLVEAVSIPGARRRLTEYPHQFSGGIRQRAVIAMALACEPDVLICDEPTTALDVTIQAQILELLDDIQAERDLGIVFITHDMGVIAEIADRVDVMYAGEIVETAPAVPLFSNSKHPYTQGLLESIPGRHPDEGKTPHDRGRRPDAIGTGDVLPIRAPLSEGLRRLRLGPSRLGVGERSGRGPHRGLSALPRGPRGRGRRRNPSRAQWGRR